MDDLLSADSLDEAVETLAARHSAGLAFTRLGSDTLLAVASSFPTATAGRKQRGATSFSEEERALYLRALDRQLAQHIFEQA